MELDPRFWHSDILPPGLDEMDFRRHSTVLSDRYTRGSRLYRQLGETGWWRFVRVRELKHRIYILRGEYRDQLSLLFEGYMRQRAVNVEPVQPGWTGFKNARAKAAVHNSYARPDEAKSKRGFEIYMPPRDDEPARTLFVPAADPPAAPAAPQHSADYHGHGGSFGGAGASGSWDSGSSGGGGGDYGSSGGDSGGGGDCGGGSSCD
jgi:hypothetical protein